MKSTRTLVRLAALLTLVQAPSFGQQLCLEPSSDFYADGVMDHPLIPLNITGVASFDDGSGPALFVSGLTLVSAGAEPVVGLARWDGAEWGDAGVTQQVDDIAVYDDGNGAMLYVATGAHPRVSTWNGAGLTPLADQPNGPIFGFDVIDLGTGPELYISGSFTAVGLTPAQGIARWDGSQWTAVPNGANVRGPFEALDDGSGLKLYGIANSTSLCAASVRRLDGGTWTNIGTFFSCSTVLDLHVHDDGTGAALYVAGQFSSIDGVLTWNVARWDGASWSAVSGGIGASSTTVCHLASFDDGGGTKLYAAGVKFPIAYGLLSWNGVAWQAVGAGLGNPDSTIQSNWMGGQAFGTYDDGSGEQLVIAGDFHTSGNVAVWHVARWNGATWSGFGTSGQGIDRSVWTLRYLDDGSGPALYAGGEFSTAGTLPINRIARWSGSAWTPLGTGIDNEHVYDIEVFDDGSGVDLYAGGVFTSAGNNPANKVARWDGVQWSALAAGPGANVLDLMPSGGLLYAALWSSPGIAAWNGSSWSTPGGGVGGVNAYVTGLAEFEGYVYATGPFTSAGGVAANGIARYDPNAGTWSAAGTTVPGGGLGIATHDDGEGNALYVVNKFALRRLRGGVWTQLPAPGLEPTEMISADLGLGRPSLIVTTKREYSPIPWKTLQQWTGSAWVSLATDNTDYDVNAIAIVPGGSDCSPEIFVGGRFTKWGATFSHHVAKLTLCGEPGIGYCFGDGTTATPCPCFPPNTVPNPSAAPGHGCANSFNPGGAKMCAVGTTNPDTVTLRASGLTFGGFTQFFKGDQEVVGGIAYADGVRCVGGLIIRFGGQNAVLGTAFYPNPSLGLTAPISNAGTPPGSGAVGHYQAIYRNAQVNFCNPSTLNLTNAVEITWN
jgi:hypothetical protein